MRLLAPILFPLVLAGCGLVYTIDVQQGNYVAQDVAAKLKTGMTKAEVRQLLGTPLLVDPFHNNRWDYFFSSVKRGKAENRTRLSVFFENDKVVNFIGDARPALPAPVNVPVPAASSTPPATPAK